MLTRRAFVATAAGVSAAFLTSCASASGGPEGQPLIMRLNLLPWAMHDYLYAAEDQGYFSEEKVNVTIEPGQAGQAIQLVGAGKEHVGITDATAFLTAVDQGAPLVAIAMDWPNSPGAIFFKKSSGISSPDDLVGKKVCTTTASNTHESILAALKKSGIDSGIEFVTIPTGASYSLVVKDRCFAAEGFAIGQPQFMEDNGIASGSISVGELGLELYGNLIFTNKTTLEDRRDDLQRFVQSIARGQLWAYQNVTAAIEKMIDRNPAETLSASLRMVPEIYSTQYQDNPEFAERWGLQTEDRWGLTIDNLREAETLKNDLIPTEVFTNEFVEQSPATAEFAELFRTEKWTL